MKRRSFLKQSLTVSGLGLVGGAGYGRFIERHAVVVVTQEIDLGLPQPLSVAVLSDIHFDPLHEADYLAEVIARVNRLSPDVLLHAGDFLSRSAERLPELLDVLRMGQAGAGVFAVLGNHDHSIGADGVASALATADITVLRNQSVPLPGLANWYLTGLESFWSGKPTVAPITATPSNARHMVLVHEPDSFDLLTDPRIALQVSGHTHGGQVRLPLLGAVCLPSWGKKYSAGLFERGDRRLYVNRGIGTVVRHCRLNCRPEITLLKLT